MFIYNAKIIINTADTLDLNELSLYILFMLYATYFLPET